MKITKRIIALTLAMVMVLSIIPVSNWIYAEETSGEVATATDATMEVSSTEISTDSTTEITTEGTTEASTEVNMTDEEESGIIRSSQAFTDTSVDTEANPLFVYYTQEEVLDYCEDNLGVPYVLGGSTKSGWDCGGFVLSVMKKFFIDPDYVERPLSNCLENELEDRPVLVGSTYSELSSAIKNNVVNPSDIIVFFDADWHSVHTGIIGKDNTIYHAYNTKVNTCNSELESVISSNPEYAHYKVFRGCEVSKDETIKITISSNDKDYSDLPEELVWINDYTDDSTDSVPES